MRVLVTGAAGFVGREIVKQLSRRKLDVFQMVNLEKLQKKTNDVLCGKVFAADITEYKNLAEIEKLENIDAVIHSAGLAHQFKEIEKEKFTAVNVTGTENILKLSLKLNARHFILISSTAVYGIKKTVKDAVNDLNELEIDESALCQPDTPYAVSKLKAEERAREFCEKNNMPLTILRLAPVIGEGNVGNAARLAKAIDERKFLWVGAGENLKTLIYKKDAARACVKVLVEKKGGTEIFNLAAQPVKMKDFVSMIAEKLHRKIPKFEIPAGLFKLFFAVNRKFFGFIKIVKLSKTLEKWLSDDVYSSKKIAEVYNFKLETTIEQAIGKQIEWYKNEEKKGGK